MAIDVLPDPSSNFGERVRARLAEETVVWLTTIAADGTPQPNPVWFLWEGEDTVLIYNKAGAKRLEHVKARPRVSLNFDGDGQGGEIVVMTGVAELLEDFPLAHEHPRFAEKYAAQAAQLFGDAVSFAHKYPAAMRVHVTRVR